MNIQKIITTILFIGLIVCPASASVLTSSASPDYILKCSPSTISATFSDAGVTSVNAILTSVKAVQPMVPGSGRTTPETQSTTVALSYNGTFWVGTFGNDANLLWGERDISYVLNGVTTYSPGTKVFVYSDVCTGTDLTNYTQLDSGLGKYTSKLYTGMDLVTWSYYSWIEYFGYMFYVLIIFMVVVIQYMKSQNIIQPLIITIFMMLVGVSTIVVVPSDWQNYVIMVIGLLIGIVYYRLFVRE